MFFLFEILSLFRAAKLFFFQHKHLFYQYFFVLLRKVKGFCVKSKGFFPIFLSQIPTHDIAFRKYIIRKWQKN